MRYNNGMEMFWYVMVFIFGAMIGSFLNVVIYRMHTGRSLNGRSHCMTCGTTLTWYELFPIISYLALQAKCRYCTAYIPSRYLIVEMITGVSFLAVFSFFRENIDLFIIHAVLLAILIVIMVYDIRHTIIPDELTLAVGGIALVLLGYNYTFSGDLMRTLFDVLAALGASLFFWGLWYVSKGRWIGLGDAKLAFPLALIVGTGSVFSMVVLSFWIGAAISLLLLGLQRLMSRGKITLPFVPSPLTIKSEVPFAPFLILGFLCVYFYHASIFEIIFAFIPL